MQIAQILDGCLEGGDFAGAAAAVLAHPFSKRLDKPTVTRFFGIGFLGAPVAPVDAVMLRLMGDFIHLDEELTDEAMTEAMEDGVAP